MSEKFFLSILLIFFAGCASQKLKPGVIEAYTMPEITTEMDPAADLSIYKNFAVCPVAESLKEITINPIVEKQLLFIARNCLESLAYNYVDDIEQADFYVGVVFANDYGSVYEPPSVRTIPWYVPGETQTTYINLYGSTGYHWGTATTETPGHYIPLTYTTSGKYVYYYLPYIQILIVDKTSREIVWRGTGALATPESDIRRSAQFLIGELLVGKSEKRFPICTTWREIKDVNDGTFGVGFQMLTLNGNDFYPVVSRVWYDSPAHRQELKVYDILTHINGQSTLNWPRSKVRQTFDKNEGDDLRLTINRGNKTIEISLMAVNEGIAQASWRRFKTEDKKANIVTRTIKDIQLQVGDVNEQDYLALIP